MLLEKKSYLIDFAFKFNAIKFGNLLMNWFNRKKMFTYCYNKFRPLNCMHYVKCSVNTRSLLLTWFWLLQKVCGTLDHYFTTAHTVINSKWSTNSLSMTIETRHHAQAYATLRALVDRGLSLAARCTKTAAELRWFHWPVLVMTALEPHNICCRRTWSSNQTGGGAILAFSSFFNQIPHQKSEISVGILSPTWR